MAKAFSGCVPASASGGSLISQQPVRDRVVDVAQLSAEDYRPLVVPMVATMGISGATSVLTANVRYTAPATHKFVMTGIMARVALVDDFNEIITMVNPLNALLGLSATPGAAERVFVKAMNCSVTLQNTDLTQDVFKSPVRLSDLLLSGLAGAGFDFSRNPFILGATQSLEANFTLGQTTSLAIVTGMTEYGLVLVGFLDRVASS